MLDMYVVYSLFILVFETLNSWCVSGRKEQKRMNECFSRDAIRIFVDGTRDMTY